MVQTPKYDLFISYVDADRAWVEGYLLNAFKQAGVRYCSEAAFVLGVPRLLEFERAIQQSRRTLLVLSHAYMASDLNQFIELLAESYGLETGTWPVIPLILEPVKLPPHLSVLVPLNATNSDEWEEAIKRLCADLQHPVEGSPPKPPPCPYPGMIPFSEADSDRFFGREREVEVAIERLHLYPFIAAIGPSGSGKSSLVFAGIIPALRRSGLFGPGEWLIHTIRPGKIPLTNLETVLGDASADPGLVVVKALATQPNAQRLLLIVDQFEEVFTQAEQEAVPFQEVLLHLIETPNCYLILTVRADFYPDLMESLLWRKIQSYRLEIVPLDAAGLHEAIIKPAENVGVYIEAALVERLVVEAAGEPGVLPLIQETLVLLWEKVERRFLPLRAYESLVLASKVYKNLDGRNRTGLQIAIANRADVAVVALSEKQRQIARRIFIRLVHFGEGRRNTRRQQLETELKSAKDDPHLFRETLEHLITNRLLTPSGEESEAEKKIDIAHEALIESWEMLQGWLKDWRKAEETRRRLMTKVDNWEGLKREGGLLDIVELKEAEDWLKSSDATELGYPPNLLDLVEASRNAIKKLEYEKEAARQLKLKQAQKLAEEQRQRAEEQRQRAEEREQEARKLRNRLMIAITSAVVAVLAAIGAIFGFEYAIKEGQRADNQARIATSRQLAAQAINQSSRFDLALLQSLAARHVRNTLEARGSLFTLLSSNPKLITYLRPDTYNGGSLALSPDGKTIAFGNSTKVILWDISSRQMIGEPLNSQIGSVANLAFSPDGKVLAAGSYGGQIRLWNLATRQPMGEPIASDSSSIEDLAFSPDSQTLASSSRGENSTIKLWRVADRQLLGQMPQNYRGEILSIAFSPDGRTLASAGGDGDVRLWDVTDPGKPRLLSRMPARHGTAWSVAFSPDGQMVASAGADKQIILWDVSNRENPQPVGDPLLGHTNGIFSIVFSPDGKTLAAASRDSNISLWNVNTRQPIGSPLIGHSDWVLSVAFSPDGKRLVSSGRDSAILLWDVTNKHRLGESLSGDIRQSVNTLAFNESGKLLASGGADNTVRLWDVQKRQHLRNLPVTGSDWQVVHSLAFSPNGKTLAYGDCANQGRCTQGSIHFWDIEADHLLGQPLIVHQSSVYSLSFSPDGKLLASGDVNGIIILWDITDRNKPVQISQPIKAHRRMVFSLAFDPGSKTLVSGGNDGTIIFWDIKNPNNPWKKVQLSNAHRNAVTDLAFSPSEPILASGGGDNSVVLWDITNRNNPQQLSKLRSHTDWVQSVAFSPDGKILVSSGYEGIIKVWDVGERKPLGQPLTFHTDHVPSVVFSPNGKTLASGSWDGSIILWNLSFESWQDRACSLANRNLTQDEWNSFIPDIISKDYRRTCPKLPFGESTPPDAPTAK